MTLTMCSDPLLSTRMLPLDTEIQLTGFIVMKDPVILPISRVVVDRGTIRTVLLSKELDPFNNQP